MGDTLKIVKQSKKLFKKRTDKELTMSSISPSCAEPPFTLTIDIGTSSYRVMLFDQIGRVIEGVITQEPHKFQTRPDGTAIGVPDEILDIIFRCIDNTLNLAGSLTKNIEGVGVTTLVGNILGIDETTRAVTPLLTYADTRASNDAMILRKELDEQETHQRTGCYFHPSYAPAQLRWISHARPMWLKQTDRWASISEYLFLKVFGEAATGYSIAAWTGLLNRRTLQWDEELLAKLPIDPEHLFPLCDCSHSFSSLITEYSQRWPALQEVPWFAAIGDGASANLGSGCVSPSQIALTLGSTGAMRIVSNVPVEHVPTGLWNYMIDQTRSLTGGAMTEGGNAYAWMQKNFQFENPSTLEQELTKVPPNSHGLTILPLFSGERSPGWVGSARATIHGLSLDTQPVEILRAMLEAIGLRFSLIYELLAPLAKGEVQIIASGGALLRSPLWLQIMADVLNRPVIVSTVTEASSRGTALLVLESLSKLDMGNISHFYGKQYQPNMKHHEAYKQARNRQKVLYKQLISSNPF